MFMSSFVRELVKSMPTSSAATRVLVVRLGELLTTFDLATLVDGGECRSIGGHVV